MKLIFIYGPPAAGKLTVAKELSKLTGFQVFHNHLLNDLVDVAINFEKNEDYYWKIVNKIRLEILILALKHKKNLILTFCYAKSSDDRHICNFIKIIKKYKGKIYFIQLIPHKKELMNRVIDISRKQYGKLKNKHKLKKVLNKWDFYSSVPHEPNFTIDNTTLSPKKVALKIKKHYKL